MAAELDLTLLHQVPRVRRLALELVRDQHLADDLAQEALLIALRRGAFTPASWRAWFQGVLRNLLSEHRRRGGRLLRRERAAARPESQASTVDVLAEISTHHQVVECLRGLPAHYREILYLRYFRELPPREIASELEMPVSTVKTRLARGLEMMRQSLDDRHDGERQAWVLAVLPLLKEEASLRPALTVRRFALAAAGIVVVTLFLWKPWLVEETPSVARLQSAAPGEPGRPSLDAGWEGGSILRNAEEGTEREAPGSADEAVALRPFAAEALEQRPLTERRVWQGKVLGPDGGPQSGILLRHESKPAVGQESAATAIARSNAVGEFELRPLGSGRLELVNDGLVTLLDDQPWGEERALVLVVTKAARYEGQVLAEGGATLVDVVVELRPPEGFWGRFPPGMQESRLRQFVTRTDGAGRFALERAPRFAGAYLVFRLPGFNEERRDAVHEGALTVELSRSTLSEGIPGRVVHVDGRPARDVLIACGSYVTRSDEHGAFRIPIDTDPQDPVVAFVEGRTPGILRPQRSGERAIWPVPLEIRLGGEPVSLRGRIVDGSGRPCPGLLVWPVDPTVVFVPSGKERRDDTRTSGALSDFATGSLPLIAECRLRGGEDPLLDPVPTDAAGKFALNFLCPRPYRLRAMDPNTLVQQTFDARTPGPRLHDFTWSSPATHPLRGQVQTPRGQPIPGVRVSLRRAAFEVEHRGEGLVARTVEGRATFTDAAGAFESPEVQRSASSNGTMVLLLDSDAIVPQEIVLEDRPGLDEAVAAFVAPLRRRIQVFVSGTGGEFAVRMVGEQEEPLRIYRQRGTARLIGTTLAVPGGASEEFFVSSEALQIQLLENGEIREERALQLAPGICNVIRF
jgi:RNA polymerase sigma-70 factor (ECF subfamily)